MISIVTLFVSLPSNPINADTEAPDDDYAQISLTSDPDEQLQTQWLKYLERI